MSCNRGGYDQSSAFFVSAGSVGKKSPSGIYRENGLEPRSEPRFDWPKAALLAALSMVAAAPRAAADTEEIYAALIESGVPFERISVVGSRARQYEIPGAATYIGPDELEVHHYDDIHRILRMVPGVNIQEEDGFGLRPNIGLRGTGADRSSKITLMEDGVLIAPAPYAAPAAYYFPTPGRLQAVEVRKGSSAIKFGPQTIGGAINLVSSQIPEDRFAGRLKARIGEQGLREIHANLGGTSKYVDFMIETFQADNDGFKKLPGGGDTGFDIEDYMAKLRLHTAPGASLQQSFELKLGTTDQLSNETYLGIIDEDFREDPFQRYAASANDRFTSTHYQIQGLHHIQLSGRADVTTIAYYNKFERDWFKLDDLDLGDGRGRIRPGVVFDNPGDPLNQAAIRVLKGQADSIDDALQLRHNNREYYSWGVQSMVALRFDTGRASHDLEVGLRYHRDQEDRLQNRENFKMENGVLVPTSIDPLGSQANRVADAEAFAAFVQDEIVWRRFRFVPGIRVEVIDLKRTDFSRADPDRASGPSGVRANDLTAVVPGIGMTYDLRPEVTLLFGVHKGFGPPSPSQANARQEESVNYEAGLRYAGGGLNLEAIGFYNDYSNLVGICTASAGCGSGEIGDQFNAGQVNVIGAEISGDYTAELRPGWLVPVRIAYTFTDAEFQTGFSDSFFGDVTAGDKLPYIPRHQLFASLGLEIEGFDSQLAIHYSSATRNRAGQGPIELLNRIDQRTVVDLAAGYRIGGAVRLFVTVENLFDNEFVVARRPYGARPGKPRTLAAGLDITF